ncbi:thioredoxin domain-containing protein 17-like [Paramacrobiotus metropolitanus]|uniref:thioredoxin domain-containing protein 17-like n=1 Tax=Paramacrobiotus metropolitanus TaxID=2943436 RepID=UPI0024460830|nr:thioredoxin domain-containing protein 17-like [Paramacrobiotus metropolitanus]XP_055329161.1 thioredoxin domain-containing protein 17-like [Paramacrobiotus metropolitanus]
MAKIHNVSDYPEYSAAIEEVQVRSPKIFAYFYGNEDPATKKSWCPDCVLADPVIKEAFKNAPQDLEIVRVAVGERAAWKTPDNVYRLKAKVKCIPTLIKLENGEEAGRLEELDCAAPEKVNSFLRS